jgi:DNA-binding transcriptional regulator LsrR (DeoR family)
MEHSLVVRTLERKSTPVRAKRRDVAAPLEFGGDPVVWAAWLYYEERMTQEEVAERLGVSRATVVNVLQDARDRGIVTIAVSPKHLQSVRLAHSLCSLYGLERCVVVPDDGGRRSDFERIGQAGARVLNEILDPADVLGVAWGRTVLALTGALVSAQLPGVSVVQIVGSAIGTAEFSPELCTSNIAYRIGAGCINLHAPGIVSRPEIKALFMKEPEIVRQFEIIRSCTKILFGVGGVDSAATILSSGYMSPATLKPYLDRGAVGVLAGRFLDRKGKPVLGNLDDQMIGLTLKELLKIPERICVAGGLAKVDAIEGMLNGGYATLLVTDELTANALCMRGQTGRKGAARKDNKMTQPPRQAARAAG